VRLSRYTESRGAAGAAGAYRAAAGAAAAAATALGICGGEASQAVAGPWLGAPRRRETAQDGVYSLYIACIVCIYCSEA
jgi:hypothetical protein